MLVVVVEVVLIKDRLHVRCCRGGGSYGILST